MYVCPKAYSKMFSGERALIRDSSTERIQVGGLGGGCWMLADILWSVMVCVYSRQNPIQTPRDLNMFDD